MDIITGGKSKARKGGKKNRKFNRMARRPSHARYNAEKRWEKNKKRRIEKQRKFEEKKAKKKLKREEEEARKKEKEVKDE